jgi:3-oxoacyl-[acyl-carrier protein] reductase
VDLELTGKACIVTGATSGIGAATARLLVDEGANVLLVARNPERVREAASELSEVGVAYDITQPAAARKIVADCEEAFGRIDVLVNSAGTSDVLAIDELTDEEWELQWQLNVMGPMRLMEAAAPRMAERGWGRIVNVASSAGKRPSQRNAAYTVTKTAELALSRVYAENYAAKGVLINAVAPGPTASELWTAEGGIADQQAEKAGRSREDELQAAAEKVPLGRLADPDEVAAVIVFLCSAQASDVAGASWSVDGGIVPLYI